MRETIRRVAPSLLWAFRAVRTTANNVRTGSWRYPWFVPPGHFYSPLPDYRALATGGVLLPPASVHDVPGIDLHAETQLELLRLLRPHGESQPRVGPGVRFVGPNSYFSAAEAAVLQAMIRHLRPRSVIEVGSGFSTIAMLDALDPALGAPGALASTVVTTIDIDTARLDAELSAPDRARVQVVRAGVQGVDLALFDVLGDGDILFIDSSHVVKAGSDLHHLVYSVLPRLAPGVVVHFHDIFWPFEYPLDWYRVGRAYNEAYVLRAFLQFNSAFEIMCFTSYLTEVHPERTQARFPWLRGHTSSIWIRRV